MEGLPVLITDFNEGVCYTLLEFLNENNAISFVCVKDFETIHEVYVNFPSTIPTVLDIPQNLDSVADHLSVLPIMSCIFNFDGDTFEDLYRKTFDHFTRSVSVFKDDFNMCQVQHDMLEAAADGYTLIVNLHNFPLPTATNHLDLMGSHTNSAGSEHPNPDNSSLKTVMNKVFGKPPPKQKCPAQAKEAIQHSGKCPNQANRGINPISLILRRIFLRFNPCSGSPGFHFMKRGRGKCVIKSPAEINKYIRRQQSQEIKIIFEIIHESALRNWIKTCKEKFKFTPLYEHQFQMACEDIQKKGEDGRKLLLDQIYKDMERTKEWNHVLGEKTISKLKTTREKEVDLKVQHFCLRKIAEAREKIDDDIQQNKLRTKRSFYNEILDEQLMELIRISEKFQKQTQLLMLPYTGELKILAK